MKPTIWPNITILISFMLFSCSTIPKGITAIQQFNKNKYLGKWYEIARIDFKFERDLNNTTAEYSSLKNILFNNFIYYRTKFINKMGEHLKIIEYPLILLFIISGAIFLISTNDLISIFLSIELQSYGLYLLSTIYRNSELSTTGGLIYFLLGGLSSCFILLGTALLYSNSGTTSIDGFYIITSISDTNSIDILYKTYYISFSLIIFSIGFLFKISAAPFHF